MTITNDDIIRSLEALSPEEMEVFMARLMERTGISLPATTPAPFMTMGAPVITMGEPGSLGVHLLDHGPNKIMIIKVVRDLKGLGLKEAKDLVESAPVLLVEELSPEEAKDIARRLEQAGAKVALR